MIHANAALVAKPWKQPEVPQGILSKFVVLGGKTISSPLRVVIVAAGNQFIVEGRRQSSRGYGRVPMTGFTEMKLPN